MLIERCSAAPAACAKRGGVDYTVKLELLFATIGGIEPHASARTLLPSLRAATSKRLSDTSRGGIGQPSET
jgi:hypothetical protein